MLELRNLEAAIGDTQILKGVNLKVNAGEIHAIMGPNGSGKSTLAACLAGREDIDVSSGEMLLCGQSLTDLAPEERAGMGVFLAFQYPVSIPGVSNSYFLKEAFNSVRRYREEEPLDAFGFLKVLEEARELVGLDKALLSRAVNDGFSGGEKKRNEIMQMAVLQPKLAILDETDSGLDIDALRVVAAGVNALRRPDSATIIVTHYQRLLDYIVPDVVHVFADGRIVQSGGKELALELEERGYDWIGELAGVA